eukprot:74428-Chlamydomonas_euryale.AAC.1
MARRAPSPTSSLVLVTNMMATWSQAHVSMRPERLRGATTGAAAGAAAGAISAARGEGAARGSDLIARRSRATVLGRRPTADTHCADRHASRRHWAKCEASGSRERTRRAGAGLGKV